MRLSKKLAHRKFRGLHGFHGAACCETCDLGPVLDPTIDIVGPPPIVALDPTTIPERYALREQMNAPLPSTEANLLDQILGPPAASVVTAALDQTVKGSPLPLAGAIGGLLWKGPLWALIGGVAGYLLSRPSVRVVDGPDGPAIVVPPPVAVKADSMARYAGISLGRVFPG